jgi:hypothetical protein
MIYLRQVPVAGWHWAEQEAEATDLIFGFFLTESMVE